MLKVIIPPRTGFNNETQEFIDFKGITIQLEHSLVSISKWEAKYHKPFLVKTEKTNKELIDYVKCMTITQNVPDEAYYFLTKENLTAINEYIGDSMTATWFTSHDKSGHSSEQVTSELIYYWMISYQIPFECQRWHLNRLMTLIRVCNVKNSKQQKMSKHDTMKHNASLNAARRARLNSKG